jgi:hypothetical protein
MDHALAWNRIGTPREKPGDLEFLGQSAFWNTLISEARLQPDVVPASWLEREWPPVAGQVSRPSSGKSSRLTPKGTPAKAARKPRKP